MTSKTTPHYEKLLSALENEKLPDGDKPRLKQAIEKYHAWLTALDKAEELSSSGERLTKMVELLNEYKLYIDLELIFDSDDDFLYRQKGQLKLDNSIVEEFLPRIISPSIIPELEALKVAVGPTTTFSSVYFESSLDQPVSGGGISIRTKDQDFAISKKLYITASHDADFREAAMRETYVGYIVAEIKTNLDKTMFQEACATAHDVKASVPGARYFLLCEWLDMTPVSTAQTAIDEVLILRKAKRMNSNIRSQFGEAAKRKTRRGDYLNFLKEHPLSREMFERFVGHVQLHTKNEAPQEGNVLDSGYF